MALRDIKRRIKSVKSTAQITKAMEVVSATKMRRSQGVALAGRPFALAALDVLKNISTRIPADTIIPLLTMREIKTTALVIITSDRGLAGAFNANVVRLVERWMRDHADEASRVIAVGKKVLAYATNHKIEPVRAFTGFGDYISRDETEPLAEFLLQGFLDESWDRVIVFYTNFRTTLKQETRVIEVLPIHPGKIAEIIQGITPEYGKFSHVNGVIPEPKFDYEYAFEPSPATVLDRLLPTLFKIQMHHVVLESNASEHSARMVAMKNASENAKDLIDELSLQYNKARQAGITRELTEITAGSEAISN